ncbi:MAG: hypothetical protein ACLTKT_01815 [Clostridia bacterium]
METNQKYKELSIMLFKRLIELEYETSKTQEKLEKLNKTNIIKVFLDIGDVVPLLEIEKIMGVNNEKSNLMYNDFSKLVSKKDGKVLYNEIKEFFEKYI